MDRAGLLFIPPDLTHLHGSAVHERLDELQRRRYNQLCGVMAAEQFLAFEETVIIDAVRRLARSPVIRRDPQLRQRLEQMIAEETTHAGWFRSLLAEAAPELYGSGQRVFTRLRPWERWALLPLTRTTDGACLLLWFTLLIEEHSVVLSQAMITPVPPGVAELDPRFVAVHRRHLVDEARHLAINLQVIRRCFDPLPAWRRRLLATVFRHLLRNIARPRRANTAVIHRLIHEFPALTPLRDELLRAVRDEFRNHAPRSDITLPATHPLTVRALTDRPEFAAVLADLEAGWRPSPSHRWQRLALLLVIQLAGTLAYTAVAGAARWRVPEPPPLPLTTLDRWLPEVPAAILAYDTLSLYLLLPLWISDERFHRLLRAGALATLIGYICFLAFPLTIDRGLLPAAEPWRALHALLRHADQPINTMPSLHVAYTALVALAWGTAHGHHRVWLWGVLIIASTVLIRQHGLLDLGAGVLLAWVCWMVGRWPKPWGAVVGR